MKPKSLIKLSSGDIRAMANDSGFKSWAGGKGMDVDKLSSSKMHSVYMRYLKSKGQ